MSLVNSASSIKEIEKLWSSFLSNGKEIDSFFIICKTFKDQVGASKEILHKKKFQQVLIEYIELLLTKIEVKGKQLAKGFVDMLNILEYLVSKRKLQLDVKPALIQNFFLGFERVSCVENEVKYSAKVIFEIFHSIDLIIKNNLSQSLEDIMYPKSNEILELICKTSSPVLTVQISSYYNPDSLTKQKKTSDVTLKFLETYKNYLEKSHRNFNLREFINMFFNNIKTVIEQREFKNCEVECKKFEIILNIAKLMNLKDKNFLNEFFNKFGEKIKQIFVLCVNVYSIVFSEKDVHVELQELFDSLMLALKGNCEVTNTTVLNIPMVIFQLLFNTVIPSQPNQFLKPFVEYLKLLSLRFIWNFYFEPKLFKFNLFEIMIPQLIFSQAFFVNNFGEASEIWEKIWKKISENFNRKIAKMLFEEFERNGKNFEYLEKFCEWVEGLRVRNSVIYDEIVKQGFYKEVLGLLKDVEVFDCEYRLMMLLEKGFVAGVKKIDVFSLAKQVFEVFCLKTSPESLEIYEVLIKEILCLCNSKIFLAYTQFLKTLNNNLTILSALKSIERAFDKKVFSEFLETEKNNEALIKVLVTLTPTKLNSEKQVIIDIFKSLLSCTFLIAQQKNFHFSSSTALNILPLIESLRKFSDFKKTILTEIFEQLLQTLLCDKGKLIKNPTFFPLFIEILCEDYLESENKYRGIMRSLKELRINFFLIATHHFFAVFFYYLMKTQNYFLWETYQDLCFHTISTQFTIYDLENWLDLFTAWPAKHVKIDLLKLLTYGIKRKEIDEQAQHYIYFTHYGQIVSDYSNSNLIFSKELSIVTCIYIENVEKNNIFALKCTKNNLVLSVTKNSIIIKINEVYKQVEIKLLPNSWTNICINISNKGATILNKNKKISVFVNGKFFDGHEQCNCKLANNNKIEKVYIGNSPLINKENENFVGKISFLGIMKKNLDPEVINDFSSLGCYLNMNEIEKLLVKAGKDPKDYILLDAFCEHSSRETVGIYKVNSVSALNTVNVFGVGRLLLEIRRSIRNDEVLQEFFELIKTLVSCDKNLDCPMFNVDTVRILARIIKKSVLTEETGYLITDIMKELKDHSNLILNIIISTDSLYDPLKKNKQQLKFILDSFIESYSLSQTYLYTYITLIEHLPYPEFSNNFHLYIYSDDHNEVKIYLSLILHKFSIEKKYEVINKIIDSLLELDYNFIKPHQFLTALLEMIDSVHPLNLQKKIIEGIFFRGEIEPELIENIFEVIKESMEINLDLEFIQFLLNKGFDCQSPLKEHRYYFIDTVLSRLYSISSKEGKKLVIDKLRENEAKLNEGVFRRLAYPNWLEKYSHVKEMDKEVFELFDYFFELGQKSGDFHQIQVFFASSYKVNIYQYLVQRYCYDVNINQLLAIHEEIQAPLKKNLDILNKIYKKLKNSEEFKVLVQDSIINLNFMEFINPDKVSNKGLNFKPLIVNYLNFLLLALEFNSPDDSFKFIKSFLKSKSINYFNSVDPDEDCSKVPLSIYLFTELLKKLINGSTYLTKDLQSFIKSSKIHKKLKIFGKNFSKLLETFLNEDIFTDPNPGLKSNLKWQTAESTLKSLVQDFSENFIETNILAIKESLDFFSSIFKNFLFTHLVTKTFSGDFSTNLPKDHKLFIENMQKYTEANHNTQVFTDIQDSISRNHFKIEQDYKSFKKKIVNLKYILESDSPKSIVIRQVYDKFYRWSTIKPLKTQQETIKELGLNKIYSGISPLVENKDFFFSIDKAQESPNTTAISDSSGNLSRETSSGIQYARSYNSSIYSTYCERIKVQGSYFAKLNISEKFFELIFEDQLRPDGPEYKGALGFTKSRAQKRRIWYPSEFAEIYFKRFIHQESALEFILNSGKSYFLNFFQKKTRIEVLKKVKCWSSCRLNYSQTDVEVFTNEWKKGAISNFEYLMVINQYAGRSLNDLSQHPVFPWIITNYDEEEFAYDKPENQRNLKFPIGAQSEASQKKLQKKFNAFKEETMQAYHFGSHYSNCGIIVHFLLRTEPYTYQAKELQGGSFDVADRLFISMKLAWDSCNMAIGGDVKELIPEVFFNPFVFSSYGGTCFGQTSDGNFIVDVMKPNWAYSNWDFIIKNRNSLESTSVSKEINNWIDLIFGFKQSGKYAEASFNVFTSATYKAKYKEFCKIHDENECIAMTEQVYHFGQVPGCLFGKKSHPARDEFVRNFEFFTFFYKNSDGDLIFKPSSNQLRWQGKVNFMFVFNECIFYVKTEENVTSLFKVTLKDTHDFSPVFVEFVLKDFCAVPETNFAYNGKDFRFYQFNFKWSNNNFSVFNSKYLIAGLDQSNMVKIFDFKGKIVQTLNFHTMPVLCVTCTSDKIFSAGFDTKIKAWKKDIKENFVESFTFHGHSSPVIALKALDSYQILVSASSQNLILTHDTKNSECLSKIELTVTCIEVNEIGVLSFGCDSKIGFFGVNLDQITKFYPTEPVKSIKLSSCGNFCIVGYESSVEIFDIFNYEKKKAYEVQNTFGIEIHPQEKFIYFACQDKTETVLSSLYVISNRQRDLQTKLMKELC